MISSKIQLPWSSSKVSLGQLILTFLLAVIVFLVLAKLVSVPLQIDDFDSFRFKVHENDNAPLAGQGLGQSEMKA
ncbi:hypothetical protein KR038_011299 [Drosophila bunnanda]|nr:hypothetical protein KR038_011299 [Drosophila bunnanda]